MTEHLARPEPRWVTIAVFRAVLALVALAGTLAAVAGMGICFVLLIMDATPPADVRPTAFWVLSVFALFLANVIWGWVFDLIDRCFERARRDVEVSP